MWCLGPSTDPIVPAPKPDCCGEARVSFAVGVVSVPADSRALSAACTGAEGTCDADSLALCRDTSPASMLASSVSV